MTYQARYSSILPYFVTLKLYENPYQDEKIFKPNILYTYIPSYILDPLPKNMTFVKSYLLDRYRDEGDIDEDLLKRYNDTKDKYQYTLSYDLLPDDVVLLMYEEKSEYYWYFWFDKDCSDCACGRFKTKNSLEKIIETFDKKTQELQDYCDNYHPQRVGKLIELKQFHCSKGF